jgi:hypothetical protein
VSTDSSFFRSSVEVGSGYFLIPAVPKNERKLSIYFNFKQLID